MNDWISVDDRLPDDSDVLLVALTAIVDNPLSSFQVVDTDAFYTDEGRFRFWSESPQYKVTHWQYLPKPPKAKGETK
jgi:hypothetical protein